MRRKDGQLTRIETRLLRGAVDRVGDGSDLFHGYELARFVEQQGRSEGKIAFGTLYRALDSMEKAGYLESRLEAPEIAELDGRPRRRLYQVTALGRQILPKAEQHHHAGSANLTAPHGQRVPT